MQVQPTPQPTRTVNYTVLTEVLLLGGIATLFLSKWLRGLLDFYIHPRYNALVIVCAAILLLMAAVRLRAVFTTRANGGPGWIYLLLAVPLLVGVVVPAQPLGADTLAGRGLDVSAVAAPSSTWQPRSDDPATWNLLEWATALSVRGDELQGAPIDVVGFVFHERKLGNDAFYVVRYVITCCAADGTGVGLPVAWPSGSALPENDWVRVQGAISNLTVEGKVQPAIAANTVEPIAQPDNPYLYP